MKKWIISGVAAMLFAGAAVAAAQPWQGWKGCGGWCGQGGYGGMYDPSRTETVRGEVASVEQIMPMRGMGQGIGLKLKTAAGAFVVHLGPQWYIERQDVKLTAGDTIEVKGVKAVRMGQDVFIAAEVKRGQDVLKLRDGNGYPAWAGWRRGGNPQQ